MMDCLKHAVNQLGIDVREGEGLFGVVDGSLASCICMMSFTNVLCDILNYYMQNV